jgi:hypothetical protein
MTYKKDASKTFSGIRGDKDKVASPLISSATLTEAQKLDIADIGYGVSVIGISHIDDTKSGAFGRSVGAFLAAQISERRVVIRFKEEAKWARYRPERNGLVSVGFPSRPRATLRVGLTNSTGSTRSSRRCKS